MKHILTLKEKVTKYHVEKLSNGKNFHVIRKKNKGTQNAGIVINFSLKTMVTGNISNAGKKMKCKL